jgi:hypothetical protein
MAYLGNAPARSFISFERQVFTIVNSQTAYTLDHSVNNENDIRLVVNNIVQEPGSGKAYTASGTTLTLSAALTNGTDEMYCVFLGRATATNAPGAGSVGTSQIADDAVTAAKLATLTSAINFEGEPSNMRINFNNTGSASHATVLGGIMVKNNGDSVGQMTIRKDTSDTDGYINFETQPSGGSLTERLRIHSEGVVSAANGIALGVGTANTASNVLDDYEEGTWTPTFTHGGSAVSSVTVNKANYTKVGRLVYVSMNARYTGSDLTGGDLIGDGLPFTSAAGNVLGVTGGYIHDPGSGNTNYDSGIAGSHDSNTNFFLVVTPGGRYQQRWLQNYYLSFACWYFV